MRLRQVATVAHDLETTVSDFCTVLGIEVAYRDPGVGVFGLHNAVMPIGDTFLEVVAPKQEDTTAGRFLQRQGGDAGYMVILQTDESMDAFRQRMQRIGVRVVWTGDHDDIKGTHLHPKDVGGAILSVDWANPADSWRWAGPKWKSHVRTKVVREIVAAEMTSHDPEAMARRWGQVLERPVVDAGDSCWELALDRGRLIFAPPGEDGLEGIRSFHLECVDLWPALEACAKNRLFSEGNMVRVGGVDLVLVAAKAA
jgi:hypothetical protein